MSQHSDGLSSRDLARLCDLIYLQSGINLSVDKKTMLEGRLKRRMRAINLTTFGDYCNYLFDAGHETEEMVHLLDAVSTNKTDFYREEDHFEVLQTTVLPQMTCAQGASSLMKIWSAGCSTGEEPYTLAIVLSEYGRRNPGFRFRLLATDISTSALAKAERAVYTCDAVNPVPIDLRRKYFMRSRDRQSQLLRVVPELRAMIEFRRLNLMEEFDLSAPVHIIFCRNVVIYFDRVTQERLFRKFAAQIVEGGFLFVGHSESLQRFDVPLVQVAPALYRKVNDRERM